MSRVWNAIIDVSEVADSSPITEPVSLDEAKQYIMLEGFQDTDDSTPVDFTGDDTLIDNIIKSSREAVEKFTGLSLVSKTLTVTFTNKAGMVELPYGPIGAITSLTDEDGTEITSDNYTIIGTQFKRLKSPCYENMVIVYECGYDGDDIPESLRQAILIEVLYRYDNRGSKDSLSSMAKMKAAAFRRLNWLV